jgi:hypothetical protein
MAYYNTYNDSIYSYNDLDPVMYDDLYSVPVVDSYVIAPPPYHPVDVMRLSPVDFLDPYRNYTSEIVYLWNNFDDVKKRYVIDRFVNFHPRNEVYWDFQRNYDWNDLFNFWDFDSSYNYFDDRYILTPEGRVNLMSLILFMRDIAGSNLAELAKKQCCTRDKAIAEAIWEVAESKVKNVSKNNLDSNEIDNIKKKVKKSYSVPTDDDINRIYNFMHECYQERTKSGGKGFKISNFLDKVAKEGISGSGATFKKYLLLKKKYLDKKTLKKL